MFDEDRDTTPALVCRTGRKSAAVETRTYVITLRRARRSLCVLTEEGVKALFERVAIVLFERAVERARDAIATADSMNRNPAKVRLPPRESLPSL